MSLIMLCLVVLLRMIVVLLVLPIVVLSLIVVELLLVVVGAIVHGVALLAVLVHQGLGSQLRALLLICLLLLLVEDVVPLAIAGCPHCGERSRARLLLTRKDGELRRVLVAVCALPGRAW